MKKYFVLLLMFILSSISSFATDALRQETFDISNLSNSERFDYVKTIKNDVFSENGIYKLESPEFKQLIKEHKKDKNFPENYYAAQSGYTYFKENNLSSMFTPKMDVMYMYSVQSRNNLRIIYYYSILGNLKYIEFLYGNYPNYPYYVRKYARCGKLNTTIYNVDERTEIKFNKDGSSATINYKGKIIGNLLLP